MTQEAVEALENCNIYSKSHEKKVQRKQKRLQHLITNDSGIVCCDQPTQSLAVCNAGLSTGLDIGALVTEFTKFGAILDVRLLRDKSYCFVKFSNVEGATKAFEGTHGKCRLGQNNTVIYLTYCETIPPNDRIDSSEQPLPAGLIILNDFVSPTEEEKLINLVQWSPDVNEVTPNAVLKHRQVKHFGFEFRYDTNNVDADKPLTENHIPKECDLLWEKLANEHNLSNKSPDQLTVNKYEPGQGIPSHVDTHSAFTDTIVALSLASDIVMEFRKPNPLNSKEFIDHVSVELPRRSLLIMSGESRYGWKHGITPRKIDVVRNNDGHLTTKYRQTRVSFTFRWLSSEPCKCEHHTLCDTYQNRKQTDQNKDNPVDTPSQYELENVHKVYNEIAGHFSETRHSPWPQVTEFIQQFPVGSILVDVGCGNGKYLQSNPNIFEIGCDRSDGLLNICRERQFNVFQCDCLAVPVTSNSVDGCISIAVIHHLASKERRVKAISEMIRILAPKGRALIYVWAKNQALKTKSSYLRQNKRNNRKTADADEDDRDINAMNDAANIVNDDSTKTLPIHTNRTQFEHADILVPWKLKNESKDEEISRNGNVKTFLRYYHVFEENELEGLCQSFANVSIEKSYYDQGNWCVIIEKQSPT